MSQSLIGQLPGQSFYCRLKFKGQEISSSNIISLTIREHVLNILPRIELVISDLGNIIETLNIIDNDELELSIAKDQDSKSFINLTFIMGDYEVKVQGNNLMLNISMPGMLKVKDMFQIRNRAFKNKSSQDILRQIASESGISFTNSQNVIPSDNNMTWYELNQHNFAFIKHILKRAYIFDDVLFFYANSQNKFVYTSLNKEISKIDYKNAVYNIEQTEIKTDIKDQNIYYNSFDVVNLAAIYNNISSYGLEADYFDLKVPKKAIYNKAKQSLTSMDFLDKNNKEKSVFNYYAGTYNNKNLYSEKYFESLIRNKYLINNFFSYSLAIQINANEQVNLFDKINVSVPSIINMDKQNNVLSGLYLVGGIVHNVSLNGIYKKILLLNRNGNNGSKL